MNGDFGFTSGRPVHPFVLDGDLVQTSRAFGVLFTIAADGTMRIAKPDKEEITVTEVDSGETWPVATWNNGRATAGEIAAFTSAGAGLDQPRPNTCSARLLPAGASSPTGDGVTRTYTRRSTRMLLVIAGDAGRRGAVGGAHDRRRRRSCAP